MRNVTKQDGVLSKKVSAAKETFMDEDESASIQEQYGKSD